MKQTKEAIKEAYELGLDLVVVSPNADPPVAKIMDFGKYKYEIQKKKSEARKKQTVIVVKETFNRFLEEGDKVKLTLRFRGREMAHHELGSKILDRVQEDLDSIAKVEQFPKLEGRQMTMVFAPR